MERPQEYLEALRAFMHRFPHVSGPNMPGSPIHFPFFNNSSYNELYENKLAVRILATNIEEKTETVIPDVILIEPARLLLEAGIALTPATSWSDGRTSFAIAKYGWYFRGLVNNAPLVLDSSCSEMDPRMKGIFAEELAVGMATMFTKDYLNITNIADVKSAIRHNHVRHSVASGKKRNKSGKKAKRPGKKSPDFCGIDSDQRMSFIESKGTLVSLGEARRQINRGKQQLSAVDPLQLEDGPRFVISTYFSVAENSNNNEQTTVFVDDPFEDYKRYPDKLAGDRFIRLAYAKVLRFANRNDLAELLLKRKHWPMRPYSPDERRRQFLPIGFDSVGNCVLLLHDIFWLLSTSSRTNLATRLPEIRVPKESLGKIVLANGVALVLNPFQQYPPF